MYVEVYLGLYAAPYKITYRNVSAVVGKILNEAQKAMFKFTNF